MPNVGFLDTHWTLLDTTTLPCTTATSRGSRSSRSIVPGCRPVLPSEPWSSVRGERLSARIIHCHGKIIRSVRSTESRPRVFRYARTPREATVDDAGHLHLREQEVILRGATHARMSCSTMMQVARACRATVDGWGSPASPWKRAVSARTSHKGPASAAQPKGDLLLDSRGQSRTVTTRQLIE